MVALGTGSPALARAIKAGALGESSGPGEAERAVARLAEPEAVSEAPALVGAARSRLTEAPTPAVPVSPRERANCAGCNEGAPVACEASAKAGLSTGVGETAATAPTALRAGLADGAA
jgi:hypothetical protein